MSGFAINANGGYRSVDGPDQLEDGETFSTSPPQVKVAVKTREQVEVERLVAYSDPVTGSDRLKVEADAERLTGDTKKAEAVEAKWLARRSEIAKQYPWPKESK